MLYERYVIGIWAMPYNIWEVFLTGGRRDSWTVGESDKSCGFSLSSE